MLTLSIGAIISGSGVAGCGGRVPEERKGEEEMSTRPIEEVLDEHTEQWMSIRGVVGAGVGVCDGKPCIKVYVVEKTPEVERRIPDTVRGYRVVLEESGEIRALGGEKD